MPESTITIEMTATEGVYLLNAITDRLEALKALPPNAEIASEVVVLMGFVQKTVPQACALAAKESYVEARKELI
jgi:hypothetical protein